MKTLYTLDRLGSFKPNMKIEAFEAFTPITPLKEFVSRRFPSGVSRHGNSFAMNPNTKVFNDPSLQAEIVFELYRQAHFPDKPSRYHSMFGCESAKEAAYFRGKSGCDIDTPIFEVHSEELCHRGDMSLLNTNCSILELEYRANLYWSGKTEKFHDHYFSFWEVIIPLPATIGNRFIE